MQKELIKSNKLNINTKEKNNTFTEGDKDNFNKEKNVQAKIFKDNLDNEQRSSAESPSKIEVDKRLQKIND